MPVLFNIQGMRCCKILLYWRKIGNLAGKLVPVLESRDGLLRINPRSNGATAV